MNGMEVRAAARAWRDGIELLVKQNDPVLRRMFAGELVMKEAPEGVLMEPTVTIGFKEAQVLMDDLWGSGLRPTEGTGSAGALRATERHLEDMRTLVFRRTVGKGEEE